MPTINNFDRLNALRVEAARTGAGSRQWIEFATTMFDAFPSIYATAKKMNEEMACLRELNQHAGKFSVAGHFLGTWIDAAMELPDSDTTVMIQTINATEPVWIGYYDGERWLTVEGNPVEVAAWSDMPDDSARPVTEVRCHEG